MIGKTLRLGSEYGKKPGEDVNHQVVRIIQALKKSFLENPSKNIGLLYSANEQQTINLKATPNSTERIPEIISGSGQAVLFERLIHEINSDPALSNRVHVIPISTSKNAGGVGIVTPKRVLKDLKCVDDFLRNGYDVWGLSNKRRYAIGGGASPKWYDENEAARQMYDENRTQEISQGEFVERALKSAETGKGISATFLSKDAIIGLPEGSQHFVPTVRVPWKRPPASASSRAAAPASRPKTRSKITVSEHQDFLNKVVPIYATPLSTEKDSANKFKEVEIFWRKPVLNALGVLDSTKEKLSVDQARADITEQVRGFLKQDDALEARQQSVAVYYDQNVFSDSDPKKTSLKESLHRVDSATYQGAEDKRERAKRDTQHRIIAGQVQFIGACEVAHKEPDPFTVDLITAIAPNLRTGESKSDWKSFVYKGRDGQDYLNQEAYAARMELLWQRILHVSEQRGQKVLLLCAIGLGAYLTGLPEKQQEIAREIGLQRLNKVLTERKANEEFKSLTDVAFVVPASGSKEKGYTQSTLGQQAEKCLEPAMNGGRPKITVLYADILQVAQQAVRTGIQAHEVGMLNPSFYIIGGGYQHSYVKALEEKMFSLSDASRVHIAQNNNLLLDEHSKHHQFPPQLCIAPVTQRSAASRALSLDAARQRAARGAVPHDAVQVNLGQTSRSHQNNLFSAPSQKLVVDTPEVAAAKAVTFNKMKDFCLEQAVPANNSEEAQSTSLIQKVDFQEKTDTQAAQLNIWVHSEPEASPPDIVAIPGRVSAEFSDELETDEKERLLEAFIQVLTAGLEGKEGDDRRVILHSVPAGFEIQDMAKILKDKLHCQVLGPDKKEIKISEDRDNASVASRSRSPSMSSRGGG